MRRQALLLFTALTCAAALPGCSKDLVCAADEVACGDTCAELLWDPASCGACGHSCRAGEVCSQGACLCPADRTACGSACADLASDPRNCGACGAACGGAQVCTTPPGGAATCASACADPAQTACGRGCVDLQSDRSSCGACGHSCRAGERCGAGRCLADLYLACYNSSEIREATRELQPAGRRLRVAKGPVGLADLGGDLYAASSAPGGAETVTRILRGPPRVRLDPVWKGASTPDLEYLASHGDHLYVSHSSLGTLLVLSASGAVVEELSFVGPGEPNPNPLGIAFSGDRAYVALEARDEVAVLDVSSVGSCASPGSCIHEVARVDVSAVASAGAHAKPARIAVAGGRAYVALWNLDDYWSPPVGSTGRLAAIDLAAVGLATSPLDETAGPGGLVDLGAGCLNPADVAVQGTTLYVTCGAFDYSNYPEVSIRGQGIVPVDLAGAAPVVGAILPAPGDAAPGELAFCSGEGYVADRNTGRVFRLDPEEGAVDGVELCPPSNGFAFVADLACGY